MPVALCPECDAEIDLGNPVRGGDRVSCPECDMELEVISTKPLILDYVLDDEDWDGEDWGDDGDDE